MGKFLKWFKYIFLLMWMINIVSDKSIPSSSKPSMVGFVFLIGAVIVYFDKKKKRKLETIKNLVHSHNANEMIESKNYFILNTDDGLRIMDKARGNIGSEVGFIKQINEAVLYEDGAEKSLGNAITGGILFGGVGAIAGSNIKSKVVTSIGLKLYTDAGFFDIIFLNSKVKKDHPYYKKAYNGVNNLYNHILKLQKQPNESTLL